MSAYFANSLTPLIGLGLLMSSRGGESPSVGQRVARSLPERWPAVFAVGAFKASVSGSGSRPSTHARGGAASSLPLPNRMDRNGHQDARPCFARLPGAVLRNLGLGGGSTCFWLGLF